MMSTVLANHLQQILCKQSEQFKEHQALAVGAVKGIAGMNPASSSESLLSNLQLRDSFDRLSDAELADAINVVFLEPMKHYQPLYTVPTEVEDSNVPLITEFDVPYALTNLNPRKAAGPDDIGNWLLREYAKILIQPITSILNASYREQRLPAPWKLVDVVPLPKQKPVEDATKHLRPISLTPAISKVAEDFVLLRYAGPGVLQTIDRTNMAVFQDPPPCML